jgi:hypothetical protein
MNIRRFGIWGLASALLFIAGIALIAANLIDGRLIQVVFTIGLLVVGAIALLLAGTQPATAASGVVPAAVVAGGSTPVATGPDDEAVRSTRLPDWLPIGVMAGFAATTILTAGLMLSYEVARIAGSNGPTANLFERWLWSLTHNPVTETTRVNLSIALILHFGAGILLGVVYAGFVEPRLHGPGWQRGIIFSLIPWLLSLIIFLPAIGGGFLGLSLRAGPLPILGNLILHLIYGVTLGEVYAVDRWQTESGQPADDVERRALDRSQRASALGIAFGLICGGLIGQAAASTIAPGQDPLLVAVVAAIIGSGIGFMLGSFAGLTPEPYRD